MTNWLKRNYPYIFGGMLLTLGLVVRIYFYPIQTADYTDSLIPWLKNLHDNQGFTAFKYHFSDYPPLYLYFLKFISVLPVNSLYAIKTLSVFFDLLIAYFAYKIFAYIGKGRFQKRHLFLIFSALFCIPTIILNSSMWAQCDAIYAACVLACFYYLLKDNPVVAAIIFGIAVSFKLQSIFILPVLIGYWLSKNKSWEYMILIPVVYVITIVPAWFSGGSLIDLLLKYIHQSGEYQALSLSAPTIFSFVNEASLSSGAKTSFEIAGITAAGIIALFIIIMTKRLLDKNRLNVASAVFISLISVLFIPFFLPHMHERYFFLADIFSLIFAIEKPRYWYIAALVIFASLFSYLPFLSASVPQLSLYIIPTYILGMINFAAILTLLLLLIRNTRRAW